MQSELIKRGEEVYSMNRALWEKDYFGKIIAIEVETGDLAGIGNTLDEACGKALKKYPNKRFYLRKVGPDPTTTYLLWD
ncbi:MAG: hypothetical protein H3Z54_10010 [archaeon]|nr:hypothetical protein [archaeon]